MISLLKMLKISKKLISTNNASQNSTTNDTESQNIISNTSIDKPINEIKTETKNEINLNNET